MQGCAGWKRRRKSRRRDGRLDTKQEGSSGPGDDGRCAGRAGGGIGQHEREEPNIAHLRVLVDGL